MPIDTRNSQYSRFSKVWGKMRDVIDGQDAVQKGGEKYLPKLDAQSPSDYDAYKSRAVFYNATGRTVDGLTGMVFMKDPTLSEIPDRFRPYLDDVDMNGLPFSSFAEQVMDELVSVTRCGILVDYAQAPADVDGNLIEITVAEAEALGMRPYLSMYTAEAITNWRVGRVNGATDLTMVVLFEQEDQPGKDEFSWEVVDQYRALELDDEGYYRQRLFRKVGAEWAQHGGEIYPLKNGEKLRRIPFIFLGSKDLKPSVDKPILKDLAEMNLAHYRNTASHEHGLYWIGLPTPVITGATKNTDENGNEIPFTLGPSEFLTLSSENAQAFFMEMEGKGLDHLQQEISKKEERMAALGARMLQPEKLAVETAGALSIKRQGEIGVLSSLSGVASKALTKALQIMAEWDLHDDNAVRQMRAELNSDYIGAALSPQQITALMQAWQSGSIAHSDFIYAMQRGEVVRADRTSDDIKAEIAQDGPALAEV